MCGEGCGLPNVWLWLRPYEEIEEAETLGFCGRVRGCERCVLRAHLSWVVGFRVDGLAT